MPVTINGSGSITGLTQGGVSASALPAGSVIQVQSAVKTDTSEQSNDTFSNIPSLSVSITATASTSKFYVICNVTGSSNNQLRLRLAQDGTAIGTGVGGAVGGATTNAVFYENDNSVDVNYTITSGKNAMAAGPIAIKSGVTVTVPSGSFLTIV